MSTAFTLASAFVFTAQAALPAGDEAAPPRTGPVAVAASASVRVIRPAVIDIDAEVDAQRAARRERDSQRRVDSAGTIWIEFS
ncbi:hypothetical protein [Erythrobacter sp.]|uniref:hypothetical protein n=1 Tax=Erythrobacter sp. TaxID=1042 RepID=UPI001425D8E4|nr:hypothetical protein [Erythrobacter sp.]QIQ87105.1 MAG: hypothetical protein G9473_10720 [Erythrobacter sp.]